MSKFKEGRHYLLDLKHGIYLIGQAVSVSEDTLTIAESCRMGPGDSKFIKHADDHGPAASKGKSESEIKISDVIRYWEFDESPYDEVFDLSREGLFALLDKNGKGVSM